VGDHQRRIEEGEVNEGHASANSNGTAMSDDIIPLLKVHEYFQGASDESLQEVAQDAKVTHHPAGSVVHEANEPLTTVAFVLRGRLKAVRVDAQGTESFFRVFERGEQLGMIFGALTEPVPVRVVALEATTLLTLDYEQAMELAHSHTDLRKLWLRSYAQGLQKEFFNVAPKRATMMLALIHESPATRWTAERIVERLRGLGETLAVLSDSDTWRGSPGVRFRSLQQDGVDLTPEQVRQQIAEWHDANRVIFDIRADGNSDRTVRALTFGDRVVYFAPAGAGDAAIRRLQGFDIQGRGLRDKIGIAWILDSGRPEAPYVLNLREFASRDYKIVEKPPPRPWGRSLADGLERLIHDLRGVRIGVALGGGAARGMAHLGVLKVLEQNGIVVDMIAGTSAGAMTGILYGAGFDPEYLAKTFSSDLTPSWLFRHLPRGDQWYLVYKFRRGHFDPMLRKYLLDRRLEQLVIPSFSVTVDLVSGQSVVRDRGDATHAILQSINLPVISVPICNSHEALVDGGLVNNIPADVLVRMGCNFVIAVSVTAKMEKRFHNISAETPKAPRKGPSVVQTILRSLLVQSYSLNDYGVRPADVVIEPDVTSFDLTEFMRATELAAIGESATRERVPHIRQLLSRLDPQLFRPAADTSKLQTA
jgi:predicted acylesterase/phospholipase RssA/CRP-like cAMP-binding protein